MKTRLRHPARFVLLSAALGPAYWALMSLGPWFSELHRSPELEHIVFRPDPVNLIAFALASSSVSWLLRRPIARATLLSATWLAAWSSFSGAALFMLYSSTLKLALGRDSSELGGVFGYLEGMLAVMFMGVFFSTSFLPLTLPLGWVSILLLRWASGGLGAAALPSPAPTAPSTS